MTDAATCDHVLLHPARRPGALPVCRECGTAVLNFDVVYRVTADGYLTIDDDATWELAVAEDEAAR